MTGRNPDKVGLLETLNIFALRADYMNKFRRYLEREGLEAHDPVPLKVPVRANEDFLGRGLVVPAVPDGSDFETDANFTLDANSVTQVRIDRVSRASSWESGANAHATEGSTGSDRAAGELPLGLVDWEEAYLDLVEHRRVKGMSPLPGRSPVSGRESESRELVRRRCCLPYLYPVADDLQDEAQDNDGQRTPRDLVVALGLSGLIVVDSDRHYVGSASTHIRRQTVAE